MKNRTVGETVEKNQPAFDDGTLAVIKWFRLRCAMRLLHTCGLVLIGLLPAVTTCAAGAGKSEFPELAFIEPLPSVLAVARREGVPVAGIAFAAPDRQPTSGDEVTLLVSLCEGGLEQQWLIRMLRAPLRPGGPRESAAAPVRLYTSDGKVIVFNSAKTALQVRVLGPYQKVQAPEDARGQKESARHAADHHASVAVNSEYLALGFEPGCAVAAEVNERIKQNPELKRLFFNVSSTPLPAEQIAKVVGHAAQLGLDEDRQRTVAGVLPALFEYWNAASGAPGLSDILQKVVDVPWWSILKSGGKPAVDFRLQLEKTEPREFTSLGYALRGYSFPFVLHLNGKPAMRCSMGVVSSRPPLAACAGVVAVAAQRPDGRGPKVFLQLLSASPGPLPSDECSGVTAAGAAR